jgi:hypothetical protein
LFDRRSVHRRGIVELLAQPLDLVGQTVKMLQQRGRGVRQQTLQAVEVV